MLFKRQQLLLTLLNALGPPAGHMDFQKLLFLYTRECEEQPSYEFVPYRFGGFSFTSCERDTLPRRTEALDKILDWIAADERHSWQVEIP